jgi:hypothetical protein
VLATPPKPATPDAVVAALISLSQQLGVAFHSQEQEL